MLASVRREQGFSTAYAFYHGRGGKPVFAMTFANYARLERGVSLPKGPRVARLIELLGLEPRHPRAKALLRAYLADHLGSEALLEAASGEPKAEETPEGWGVAAEASQQATSQRSAQLSIEQYEVLAKHPVAYACHVILYNTAKWVSPADLAADLGVKPAAVHDALRALAAAGLAERSGQLVRSPLAGKYVVPPTPTEPLKGIYDRLAQHRSTWLNGSSDLEHSSYLLLRARPERMGRFFGRLDEAVRMSAIYGDVNAFADGGIYYVVAKVHRIFRPR
jgi:hypothetical protein